ncbi:uncharacterized protein LOC124137946 [Haliotis rufescens]|uniref:uncharacterized protein LOC124137946 n=1 Tax=Haliotis rufescens TaxID=6454 RepID=UPI00201ECAA1|nr:uncharacterized protein LOC124137946 [Haliotis rufescens]
MPDCVYHTDKVKFESVRKDLQKLQILPKKYGPRLAMTVCTCRKNVKKGNYDVHSLEITRGEVAKVYDDVNLPKWDAYPQTKDFVSNVLSTYYTGLSKRKLLCVLVKALDNDFNIFAPEMRLKPIKKKEHKTSPSAVHYIIRKRKKSCSIKTDVILPLFGGNSKSLEPATGKGFCEVSRKFDCVVQFDGEKTKMFMDKGQQKTMVTVWCKSQESLGEISQYLTAAAMKIQAETSRKHEQEHRKRVAAREIKKSIHLKSSPGDQTAYQFEMDRKDIMSLDFEKKVMKDDKHKRYQLCGKDRFDPLVGGHCLNCLKTYDSLKENGDVCRYHKGFIFYCAEERYYTWSCCSYSVQYLKPTHAEHSVSGCTEGQHVWRPHLKASRGDKSENKHWNQVLRSYKH